MKVKENHRLISKYRKSLKTMFNLTWQVNSLEENHVTTIAKG